MKKDLVWTKFLIVIMLLLSTIILNAKDDELGDFYPGKITICFSAELIGNTIGDFEITDNAGIVTTPFKWFNDLAEQFQIIELTQCYFAKDQSWHQNGRYPMNVFSIQINDDAITERLIDTLNQHKDVLFAEREAVNRTSYTPNDPMLPQQWAIQKMQVTQAWDIMPGGIPEIIIGIVDSGVKWNHPDLQANMWINEAELPGITINWENGTITGGDGIDNDGNGYIDDILGWDFAPNSPSIKNNPYQSLNGSTHGTHVAGCAAAVGDNGVGIAGPAYNVKILATKHSPFGVYSNSIANGYQGIYYMANTGAHIINCSWGSMGSSSDNTANLAISYAQAQGALVVTAAGNDGQNTNGNPFYPAAAIDAFNVAATNSNDNITYWSNYGDDIDICSPGASILSTVFDGGGGNTYASYDGTSMASPVAAGVAALVKSVHPGMSVEDLKDYLRNGATPIDNLNPNYAGLLGAGRVNAYNSVSLVEILDHDLIATTITGPPSVIQGNQTTFTIGIRNRGILPAFGYSIDLMSNDPSSVLSSVIGEYLNPGETFYHTIYWTPTIYGENEIFAQIDWNLDQNPTNNFTKSITVNIHHAGTFFLENFESGTNLYNIGWSGPLNPNTSIYPGSGMNRSNALAMYEYTNGSNQNVVTPSINISTPDTNLIFSYRIVNYTTNWWGNITAFVLGQNNKIIIEVSTNGVYGNYTPIYEINNTNHILSASFTSRTIPLSDFENQDIIIRFRPLHASGTWFFVIDDVIVAGNAQRITISAQSATISEGIPATTSYSISTQNLNEGEPGTITWYTTLDGSTETTTPIGISATVTNIYQNSANVNITANTSVLQGTKFFKVFYNEIPSNMATLLVNAEPTFNHPLNLTNSSQVSNTGSGQITLNWQPPMTGGLGTFIGYKVYRNDTLLSTFTIPENITNFADQNIEIGNSYSYYITALYTNPQGESIASNTTISPISNPPRYPLTSTLYDQNGIGNVTLFWQPPLPGSSFTHIGYRVYQDTELLTTSDLLPYIASLTIPHHPNGTEQHYWVTAVYANNNESPAAITTATIFNAPADLTAIANHQPNGESQVVLNWSAVFTPQNLNNIQNCKSPTTPEKALLSASRAISGYQVFRNGSLYTDTYIPPDINTFIDTNVVNDTEYSYTIKAIYSNPDGISPDSNTATITPTLSENNEDLLYLTTKLYQNYPNPFNPETSIKFSLLHASNLRVDIYNPKGQKVKTLIDGKYKSGEYSVIWNGKDDSGLNVSSGIYFYRLVTDDYVSAKKMILLK